MCLASYQRPSNTRDLVSASFRNSMTITRAAR
jgi:hypothetical protein